jgi:multiple sugar transport system substrate-binding protein
LSVLWALIIPLAAACQNNSPPEETRPAIKTTVTGTPRKLASATPTPTRRATRTPQLKSDIDVNPQDMQGVEIQFWHIWNGPAEQIISALINEFNQENEWEITVQGVPFGSLDALNENVTQAVGEQEPPQIATAYIYQALNWLNDAEVLVVLDDFVDDPIWGMDQEAQADFYPIYWNHDEVDGKRTGLPAQRSAQMLYYNLTWAEELGFSSPPTTPAEFIEQACLAAESLVEDEIRENNGAGGWVISTNYSAVLGWLYAFNSPVLDKNGDGYDFDNTETKQGLSFMRELFEDGCAWLPETDFPEHEFANRLGLFSTGSLTSIPYQEEAFADIRSEDRWSVIAFPSEEGKPAINTYGPSFFLLESSPEEELASWIFLKWLLEPENQARLVQSTGGFPLRASVLDFIDQNQPPLTQWYEAVDLLPNAYPEPNIHSWGSVRWAISDIATQLYRWYFTLDQLPAAVRLLDKTAADLHSTIHVQE